MMSVQRRHLVEGDLQHDRQGQVVVEQGHTVGEAQAFSRRRRRRHQQPVDRGMRISSCVQAHFHVGSGRDFHLPHGERDSHSRLRSFLQRPCALPGPACALSLRFCGDANTARRQPAGFRRPRLQSPAPTRPGRRRSRLHAAAPSSTSARPQRAVADTGSSWGPRAGCSNLSRTCFWSPAHMVPFDRLRCSHFVLSPAASKPCPAFVSSVLETTHNCKENRMHADWLGYPISALDCRMASSVTCAVRPQRPGGDYRMERAPEVWCPGAVDLQTWAPSGSPRSYYRRSRFVP